MSGVAGDRRRLQRPPRMEALARLFAFDEEVAIVRRRVAEMGVALKLPRVPAADWPAASCTSRSVTLPPAATSRCAVASPRPEAPPVMTALT